MKKILALLVALTLVAGVVFAQEEEETQISERETSERQARERQPSERQIELFNLEFNIGFPLHFSNGSDSDLYFLDKTLTANTAFGLATTFNFTRKIGFTLDMDMFYGGRLEGVSTNNSNYVSLFGANVVLGPVFYVVNTENLRIPLGAGFHMYYFSDQFWYPDLGGVDNTEGNWIGRKDLQMGLALSIALQYHFNKNLYIFSKTNITIDVVRMLTFEGDFGDAESDTAMLDFHWGVKPSIGIGIKF